MEKVIKDFTFVVKTLNNMKKIFASFMMIITATCSAFSQQPKSVADKTSVGDPRYCILFIGDGFGVSAKTAARMSLGQGKIGKKFPKDSDFKILSLDKLRFNSMLTTHSANSWTTDSGPGASVYAAGENGKTDNESISYDVARGLSVETILEAAKKEGYATGLITTTRITHATPAAFASHTWFRDLEDYIASQYISSTQEEYSDIYNDPLSAIKPYNPERDWQLPAPKIDVNVDVLLGGGFRHFYPANLKDTVRDNLGNPIYSNGDIVTMTGKRSDNVNLIGYAKDRGYVYINSRDALLNLDTTLYTSNNNVKLIGLFNASHMAFEQDRQLTNNWEPSLPEMVEIAIKVLKAKGGRKGFFLMVEGGRIDHLEHANEGGISIETGLSSNQYTVDADKPVYEGGGEATYVATPSTPRVSGVYGSDYLIKEVLAYDYAVAQGRHLLNSPSNKTLIFSTSDHECGGTAIVGLHDTYDAQNNGTLVRTYALGPKQGGVPASSSGGPTATTFLTPTNLQRGDIDFGATDVNGWFPNYNTYTFQDRNEELWPKVDTCGRRIVVAYASNPLTNGNSTKAGGTPGNHTPMDIWVGADDNLNGKFASEITGKGLMDNTSLTPIMADFLNIDYPFSTAPTIAKIIELNEKPLPNIMSDLKFNVFPNPVKNSVTINFILSRQSDYSIVISNLQGNIVKTLKGTSSNHLNNIQADISSLTAGIYTAKLTIASEGKINSQIQKIIVQ